MSGLLELLLEDNLPLKKGKFPLLQEPALSPHLRLVQLQSASLGAVRPLHLLKVLDVLEVDPLDGFPRRGDVSHPGSH